MSDWFRRYLLPGFVFEAAVIAGGYATGRELVEFFLPAGPWGGLLGMVVSMLFWSAVLMISFELARRARSYDYRSFFKLLLGPGWILFEIAYLLLLVIILAVMGAAAGEIVHSLFGLPKLVGSLGMIGATGLLLFYSSATIERFLALSVGYLYLVYIVFVIWSIVVFGDRIETALATEPRRRQVVQGGDHVCGLQRRDTARGPVLHPSPDAAPRDAHCRVPRGTSRHASRRPFLHRDDWLSARTRRRVTALGLPAGEAPGPLVRAGIPDSPCC